MKAAMQGRVECVRALMLAGTRASDHCATDCQETLQYKAAVTPLATRQGYNTAITYHRFNILPYTHSFAILNSYALIFFSEKTPQIVMQLLAYNRSS